MYTKPMHLDRLLTKDIGGHPNAINIADVFGVEIELEGRGVKTAKQGIAKFWDVHNDGSLRVQKAEAEAIEYVFKTPLNLEHTTAALEVLLKHLNSPSCEVFPSYRTSVHVHLNYVQETHRHIYNAMVLSIMFDELFVSQNGAHRVGNNFCLRAKDAQGQLTELIQSIEAAGNFFHVSNQHRYSSINFVSLMKFGTIEYRSLECTTDIKRILHWIGTLSALKKAAKTFENPREIIRKYSQMSSKEFLYTILGEYGAKYEAVPGWQDMLHNGMRLAQDLAYCSKWALVDPNAEVPPPKAKFVFKKPAFPPPGAHMAQIEQYVQQMQQYNAQQVDIPAGALGNPYVLGGVAAAQPPEVEAVVEDDDGYLPDFDFDDEEEPNEDF